MKLIGWLKPKEKVPTMYVADGTVITHQGAASRTIIIEAAPTELEMTHGSPRR